MSKYPRIDGSGELRKGQNKPECSGCDKPATHYVNVEFSYMNGEDEVYSVCQRHKDIARTNLDKFFAHCATKEKFVSKAKGE